VIAVFRAEISAAEHGLVARQSCPITHVDDGGLDRVKRSPSPLPDELGDKTPSVPVAAAEHLQGHRRTRLATPYRVPPRMPAT
jgi:hypothetical protein